MHVDRADSFGMVLGQSKRKRAEPEKGSCASSAQARMFGQAHASTSAPTSATDASEATSPPIPSGTLLDTGVGGVVPAGDEDRKVVMGAIAADTSAKSPPAMSQEFASVDMDSQAADDSVNNFSAASSALMSAELPARCSDGVDPPAPTDFQQAVGVQAEADEVKSLQASTLLDSSSITNGGLFDRRLLYLGSQAQDSCGVNDSCASNSITGSSPSFVANCVSSSMENFADVFTWTSLPACEDLLA